MSIHTPGNIKFTASDLSILSDRSLAALSRMAARVDFQMDETHLKSLGMSKETVLLNSFNDAAIAKCIIELKAFRPSTDIDVQREWAIQSAITHQRIFTLIEKHVLTIIMNEIQSLQIKKEEIEKGLVEINRLKKLEKDALLARDTAYYIEASHRINESLHKLMKQSETQSQMTEQSIDLEIGALETSLKDVNKHQSSLLESSAQKMHDVLLDFSLDEGTPLFDGLDAASCNRFLQDYQESNYKLRRQLARIENQENAIDLKIDELKNKIQARQLAIRQSIKSEVRSSPAIKKPAVRSTLKSFNDVLQTLEEKSKEISKQIELGESEAEHRHEIGFTYLHAHDATLHKMFHDDTEVRALKKELKTLKAEKLARQHEKAELLHNTRVLANTLAIKYNIGKLASASGPQLKKFSNQVKSVRQSYRKNRSAIADVKKETKKQIQIAIQQKTRLAELSPNEPGTDISITNRN